MNIPLSAKIKLIKKSFAPWKRHADDCFHDVQYAYTDILRRLVDERFKRFATGGLHDRIW